MEARGRLDPWFRDIAFERFCAVHLDRAGLVLGETVIDGTRANVSVPIRRVIADAIAADSQAMLLAHNHPSGSREPSPSDMNVTRTLAFITDSLGICLHDHLIWTRQGCTSMRQLGLV